MHHSQQWKVIETENQQGDSIFEQHDRPNGHRQNTLPTAAEYTFLSAHGRFSRLDHMLAQKTIHSNFKKNEIRPSIFSDHKGMKLEINNKRETGKLMNT